MVIYRENFQCVENYGRIVNYMDLIQMALSHIRNRMVLMQITLF